MSPEQAIEAYRRVGDWECRQSAKLRERILVPYFGGDDCRRHNCQLNFERGFRESSVAGMNHAQLADLSREYTYRQRLIWDESKRLCDHFARYF